MPYAPLGRGFLTGAFDAGMPGEGDSGATLPRFAPEAAANRALVDLVREVAAGHGMTPAQVALVWVFAHGADVSADLRHYPPRAAGREPRRA